MKSLLTILLCCLSADSLGKAIELQIDYQQLYQQVTKAGVDFQLTLPEFSVYNSLGEQVFFIKGYPKSFSSRLTESLQANQSTGVTFSEYEPPMFLYQSDQRYLADVSLYDFVFVEYWAEWCPSCHAQMDEIESFVKEHPKDNILWLKVERDPTKLEGLTGVQLE